MEGARTRTQQSESLWLTVGAEEGSSRFEAWTRQDEEENLDEPTFDKLGEDENLWNQNSTRTFFIDNFNRKKSRRNTFRRFPIPCFELKTTSDQMSARFLGITIILEKN